MNEDFLTLFFVKLFPRKKFNLNDYHLPIGEVNGSVVEARDHKKRNAGKLLDKKTFLIAATSKDFVNDWKPFITRLGGNVSQAIK